MCALLWRILIWYSRKQVTQSPTLSRPTECGSRQAIQARPDHPKRSGLSFQRSFNRYAAGGTGLNRSVCHGVQQVTPVGVTSTRPPGPGSEWTQPAMGEFGTIRLPTSSHLGQVVTKLQDHPCKRIIMIAPGWTNMPWFWDLVAMSSQIPICPTCLHSPSISLLTGI